MMSAKSVAVVVLLGLSVVAGMSSDAATYYMKAGAGDWSDAANFYVDAERTQTAPHAPQKGDVVYLIGGETYTAQDSNAASFDVFANLDEIRTSPDAQNRFPTLAVTVSEGEKSVGFAYVYDRSGVITSTNSTAEIAEIAYQLYLDHYVLDGSAYSRKPLRGIGIRTARLVEERTAEQMTFFSDPDGREKREKIDDCVDTLRRRFGCGSVQRGCLHRFELAEAIERRRT